MLISAEVVLEEIAHAINNCLRVGSRIELDNGVHALPEFRIRKTDHDARTHHWVRTHSCLDLRRIDVGTTAQYHVG